MAIISTVRVTFEGMLLLFVKDDRTSCRVAFLKDVPHHAPSLVITKILRGAAPELLFPRTAEPLQEDLFLDTNKTAETKVRLYRTAATDPFDRRRVTAGNKDDFRWALNLEGSEVYDSKLEAGLVPARLKPILTIYDGMFYAQTPLSENELTRKKHNEAPPFRVGKVAVLLRSEITLDAGQQALFYNGAGSEPIPLPATENTDYGIYVGNKRMHGPSAEIDANHYHDVVASHIPPFRRILFGRHPPDESRVNPDAVCLPGWMGTTD